jgi:hypothetical protein
MTPQERERVIQLLDAGGSNAEVILKTIVREMPHLKGADIADVCRVHREMREQDAAVYHAQAQASLRIKEILELMGAPNVEVAERILVARSIQGDDLDAAELLQELRRALSVAVMPNE